ncbi:membrane protein [Bacillus phage Thornton]|uniref:Membrane protein n=1 Tax=Bacillus phage Thornton TaxID=2795746 RepID=A0A7T7GTS3_9CAUD|nr:membrane protein [Bacillus phage Thornton]QQM15029.1 membrane protein [Bacillus phage Thornton]
MWDLIQLIILIMFLLFLFANTANVLIIFSNIIEWLFDKFDVSKWGK